MAFKGGNDQDLREKGFRFFQDRNPADILNKQLKTFPLINAVKFKQENVFFMLFCVKPK